MFLKSEKKPYTVLLDIYVSEICTSENSNWIVFLV